MQRAPQAEDLRGAPAAPFGAARKGGKRTEYRALAETYEALEATSKRLEMRDELVDLFRSTEPRLMDRVVYLTQGVLGPEHEGLQLGLGDKLVSRAIAVTAGISEGELEALVHREGDLGLAAEAAFAAKGPKQVNLFAQPLTVDRVFESLTKVARAEGAGSTEKRIRLLQQLLMDADPLSARYIVRTVVGKLRLGIADMTILEALEKAFLWADDEERVMGAEKAVESIYNVHPDMGRIALVVATEGAEGLGRFGVQVGVPIRPMLAERLGSVDEILEKMGGRCAFEYKYDGMRIQAHVGSGGVALFSRRLETITSQFPDVVEALGEAMEGHEVICEFEAVVHNPETGELLPFQEVSHRRGRVHGIQESVEEYPLVLFAFDVLFADGEELLYQPFEHRRAVLEDLFDGRAGEGPIRPSTLTWVEDAAAGEDFFLEALSSGCEGVIAKAAGEGSQYRAGARGWQWIKYKRDYKAGMTDTVDLVVVGAYAGAGKRTGFYGALLMASVNEEEGTLESVCKLGTGFNDEDLSRLHGILSPLVLDGPPRDLRSGLQPDYHIEPRLVLEVLGAEVTLSPVHRCAFGSVRPGAGLAIRFPRMVRVRDDKGPGEATTSAEIEQMYRHQLKRAD
jgi:DNA ligase-1